MTRRFTMTDKGKAAALIEALARVYRPAIYLTVEDILAKATGHKLDFYYRWCCRK